MTREAIEAVLRNAITASVREGEIQLVSSEKFIKRAADALEAQLKVEAEAEFAEASKAIEAVIQQQPSPTPELLRRALLSIWEVGTKVNRDEIERFADELKKKGRLDG